MFIVVGDRRVAGAHRSAPRRRPLAGAWDGVDDQLIRIGEELGRLFPVGGDFRGGGGVSFGSTARDPDTLVQRRQGRVHRDRPAATTEGFQWRAATYDTFGARRLAPDRRRRRSPVRRRHAAPRRHARGARPGPAPIDTRVTVRPGRLPRHAAARAGRPDGRRPRVERAAVRRRRLVRRRRPARRPARRTRSTSLGPAPVRGRRRSPATTCAAAPEDYPADITARYTDVPPRTRSAPTRAELLADDPRAARDVAGPVRPRGDDAGLPAAPAASRTTTDVTGVECDSPSAVECFARTQAGLLPALRLDDGDPAARREPRQPDPDPARPGLPARRPRRGTASRPSATATPTPGSRSTSRATAGSRSTRPAAASAGRP